MKSLVKQIDVRIADDFLDLLSSRSSLFGGYYEPNAWIFRGCPDAKHTLIPSALRQNVQLFVHDQQMWSTGVRQTNVDQIQAEANTLLKFFNLADQNGLPLPEDSQYTRNLLNHIGTFAKGEDFCNALRSGKFLWPPSDALPAELDP